VGRLRADADDVHEGDCGGGAGGVIDAEDGRQGGVAKGKDLDTGGTHGGDGEGAGVIAAAFAFF
jgi:hypothetical protein